MFPRRSTSSGVATTMSLQTGRSPKIRRISIAESRLSVPLGRITSKSTSLHSVAAPRAWDPKRTTCEGRKPLTMRSTMIDMSVSEAATFKLNLPRRHFRIARLLRRRFLTRHSADLRPVCTRPLNERALWCVPYARTVHKNDNTVQGSSRRYYPASVSIQQQRFGRWLHTGESWSWGLQFFRPGTRVGVMGPVVARSGEMLYFPGLRSCPNQSSHRTPSQKAAIWL